jgi:predicted dehydrogenase
MIRLVMLGAGQHSQANHLPALARYVSEVPGEVELSGLCDLRREHAEAMARKYGFARVYTDLQELLRVERPDACIAITPIPITAQVAVQVIQAGVPLLMEKPPGATVAEAHQVLDLAERMSVQVMVSMNRRFDPALRAALHWWGDRPVSHVHGRIVRVDRREPDFMFGTAIHPLDALRAIAGDVRDYRVDAQRVDGVCWYTVHLDFASGTHGVLEVLPSAGSAGESYELFGPGVHAWAGAGDQDSGDVRCWRDGVLALSDAPARGMPPFVRNGTYDETTAFLTAVREGRDLVSSLAEVLQSVELCQAIMEEAG